MLIRLWILFCVVPLAELMLLIWIAEHTSLLFTLALVVITGLVGASLARQQGFRAWRRIADDMSQGRVPTEALFDGVLILAAGLLLITPGVMTDAVGFALLIPICRHFVRGALARKFRSQIVVGMPGNGAPGGEPPAEAHDKVIDVRWSDEPSDAPSQRDG